MAKEKIYVIGHKSPDTDTVCSAITYAEYLKKKNKIDAVAAVCGDLNPETKYVLDLFKIAKPKKIDRAAGKTLVLVDHNEKTQMVEGADTAKIVEVLDHHKIVFECAAPIKFHTEPAGSTATIVAKVMLADKFKIAKPLAGILLSAILSDTVIFKSTTTTELDIKIAKILAKTAKVSNLKNFGIEIKKQKASLKGLTAGQVLRSDYKTFDSGNVRFGVGQIEVVELAQVKARTADLLKEMEQTAHNDGLNFVALMATDIINEGSLLLVTGNAVAIEKAFGKKYAADGIYIEKMMSRKKDFLPPVMKALG